LDAGLDTRTVSTQHGRGGGAGKVSAGGADRGRNSAVAVGAAVRVAGRASIGRGRAGSARVGGAIIRVAQAISTTDLVG